MYNISSNKGLSLLNTGVVFDTQEDAEAAILDRLQVEYEVYRHKQSIEEFDKEIGYAAMYSGKVVLNWLGY